jgi:proteasome accessory factor B
MPMPAVERLVNLTIALLETRRPITFEQLRHRTGYYPQDDLASARRMFERDKEALRNLGVPIETRQAFGMDDPGYLIDRQAYELRDIDLNAEEVAALALAVDMLDASDGALALAKVSARAPEPASLMPPSTRVGLEVTAVDPVAAAIVERRSVRFEYRTADGRSGPRRIDPYGIVRRRRAWYLVGRDHDRDRLRGFRFDRMLGALEVDAASGTFDPPADLDLAAVVSGPEPTPVDVEFDVEEAGRWAILARGGEDLGASATDGTSTTDAAGVERRRMRVARLDPQRDRAWLLAIAPEAAVRAPVGLRDELMAALQRSASVHAPSAVDSNGASGPGSDVTS